MVNLQESRKYHTVRLCNEFMKGSHNRVISVWLTAQLNNFDKAHLKPTPKLSVRKPPPSYTTLPIEQLIEDLQIKVHRARYAVKDLPPMNLAAVFLDIKNDLRTIKQEFLVHDQKRINDLDGAFLEGFNEGSLQTRDAIKNFKVY